MGKLQSKSKELEESSLTLLLELTAVSLELDRTLVELLLDDCEFSSEDEDSDFTELDDALDSFSSFEDEDFAFSLLDDVTSAGSAGSPALPLLEEDNSTTVSSFCPADADELSSHPTKANAIISMDPIATLLDDRSRIFFINASKQYFSKENVIYFHPKKAKQAQSINTKAARTSRTAKLLAKKLCHCF